MKSTFTNSATVVLLLTVSFFALAAFPAGEKSENQPGVEIEFLHTTILASGVPPATSSFIARTDGTNTIYLFQPEAKVRQPEAQPPVVQEVLKAIQMSFSEPASLYFDGDKNIFYYASRLLAGDYLIADSNALNRLNWTFHDSTTAHLGYECKVASMDFRGRKYFATYAPSLPYNIGPLKARNLPGAILKLEIPEMQIAIAATKVSSVQIPEIVNPYATALATQQPISFKEFLEEVEQIGGSKSKRSETNRSGRPKRGVRITTLETEE